MLLSELRTDRNCGDRARAGARDGTRDPVTFGPWVSRVARDAARQAGTVACGFLALLLCAAPAIAAPQFDLPPINAGNVAEAVEHHPGKLVWAELVTPDLAAAKAFYAGLFGWTFRDYHSNEVDYAVAFLGSQPIGGLLQHRAARSDTRQTSWLTFLAVSDADAAVRSALDHGARQIRAPRTFAGRGRQAVLADPQGAVFALLASSTGDLPDYLPSEGAWIWCTLLATDPDADAAFYQTFLGYEVYALPAQDGMEHLLLASDDSARASVNTLPALFTNRHPHWLNFIRVADAGAATVAAVRLGGRILVETHADRHGGLVAVIADPQGAALGLMEWNGAEDVQ